MFTAVVIRVSADIFKYPTAVKENVKPDRRQWGNYTSRGFGSHAGHLKKATTALWQLDVTGKTSECSPAKGEYFFFFFFFPGLPFNSKFLRVF